MLLFLIVIYYFIILYFIFIFFLSFFFFFFFFQAEDGIRDRDVTGVQTCALPISRVGGDPAAAELPALRDTRRAGGPGGRGRPSRRRQSGPDPGGAPSSDGGRVRSEERRVGKECRCRGSREQGKKKMGECERRSSV